jgi:hypothetical protein
MEFSQNNFCFSYELMAIILFQKTLPSQMALRQFVAFQNPMAACILSNSWPTSAPVFDA